jgi:hypothetical protein
VYSGALAQPNVATLDCDGGDAVTVLIELVTQFVMDVIFYPLQRRVWRWQQGRRSLWGWLKDRGARRRS